mgnify:CR=1 FL=1
MLQPLVGDGRPLHEWLTTFHLASVVIDPYTNESAWILDTAARILRQFAGASIRVNFVVTSNAADAQHFLGPLAKEFLVFTDPVRVLVRQLGLNELPAFVFIRMNGTVPNAAEGWNASAWRAVADSIAKTVSWKSPLIPAPGDPAMFRGTAAVA